MMLLLRSRAARHDVKKVVHMRGRKRPLSSTSSSSLSETKNGIEAEQQQSLSHPGLNWFLLFLLLAALYVQLPLMLDERDAAAASTTLFHSF